jgi:hypothetical protein
LPVTKPVFSVFASFCATFFASHALDIGLAVVEHLLRRLRVRVLLEDREAVLPVDAGRVGLGRGPLADPTARGLVEIVVAFERVGADRAHRRDLAHRREILEELDDLARRVGRQPEATVRRGTGRERRADLTIASA